MRAELESMGVAGAANASSEAAIPETAGLPDVALVLLVSGIACATLRVAGLGNAWTLALGAALLAAGCVLLTAARPPLGGLVMLVVAVVAIGLELLAVAGRGLYAGTAAGSLALAGLELIGWSSISSAVLVVTLAVAAGLVTTFASSRSWRRIRDLPFDRSRGLHGRRAVVLRTASGVPHAVVCGELWTVHAEGHHLQDGDVVRVTRVDAHTLFVEPTRALWTE